MVGPPDSTEQLIREMQRELKDLQRELYGNPNTREAGIYERLKHIDTCLEDLKRVVERQKTDKDTLSKIKEEVGEITLNYRVALVYLRGIGATVGAIAITVVGAVIVGIVRFLGGS